MPTKTSLNISAGLDSLWSVEAAKSVIGQTFDAKEYGKIVGKGKVLGARITNNGKTLCLDIEWPTDTIDREKSQFSLAISPIKEENDS